MVPAVFTLHVAGADSRTELPPAGASRGGGAGSSAHRGRQVDGQAQAESGVHGGVQGRHDNVNVHARGHPQARAEAAPRRAAVVVAPAGGAQRSWLKAVQGGGGSCQERCPSLPQLARSPDAVPRSGAGGRVGGGQHRDHRVANGLATGAGHQPGVVVGGGRQPPAQPGSRQQAVSGPACARRENLSARRTRGCSALHGSAPEHRRGAVAVGAGLGPGAEVKSLQAERKRGEGAVSQAAAQPPPCLPACTCPSTHVEPGRLPLTQPARARDVIYGDGVAPGAQRDGSWRRANRLEAGWVGLRPGRHMRPHAVGLTAWRHAAGVAGAKRQRNVVVSSRQLVAVGHECAGAAVEVGRAGRAGGQHAPGCPALLTSGAVVDGLRYPSNVAVVMAVRRVEVMTRKHERESRETGGR